MNLSLPAHFVSFSSALKRPWHTYLHYWAKTQIHTEIFGMPGYELTLKGPVPDGFIAAPRDLRPVSLSLGRAILAGRFHLAGARLSFQASGNPWNRPSPSQGFALELHRFSWLSSLLEASEEGPKEAMRLLRLWYEIFVKWTPVSWSEGVLSRRLINIALNWRKLCVNGTQEDTIFLAKLLSEQGRHLLRMSPSAAHLTDQPVALILLGSVLAGQVGDGFRKVGLKKLGQALKQSVLLDGSHASRSPMQALLLLYDLFFVEDALNQRGLKLPKEIETTIGKLGHFVKSLTHADGSLCGFHGSASLDEEALRPVFLQLEGRQASSVEDKVKKNEFPDGQFHILKGRSLSVFVDAGLPSCKKFAASACDHMMSFEVSGGHDRLMILPGWNLLCDEDQEMRTFAFANALSLDGQGLCETIKSPAGPLNDFNLVQKKLSIKTRRVDADQAGTLLELEHEGWKKSHGLRHERRLYVDRSLDELRGEDRLCPLPVRHDVPDQAVCELRFHLHLDVQASLARDLKSVLLRGPGGRGFWFRHDAQHIGIDQSFIIEEFERRKTSVIILRSDVKLSVQSRIRWKLSPADA